jgi:hypothetical protein
VDWNRSPTPRRSRICGCAQILQYDIPILIEAQQCQLSLLQVYEFLVT